MASPDLEESAAVLQPLEPRVLLSAALDPSFNGTGVASGLTASPSSAYRHPMLIQPDGKVVAGGGQGFLPGFRVRRRNAGGTADKSFGGTGAVNVNFSGASDTSMVDGIAMDEQGRIIVVGYVKCGVHWEFAVARLTP